MIVRFNLVVEPAGQLPDIDGEIWIDLPAGAGGMVVAAVRHCAGGKQSPGQYGKRPSRTLS